MAQATIIGPLLPKSIWIIDIPTRAEDISKRHHNRIVKGAIRDVMEKFHAKKVPDRFKRNARQRFRHKPRSKAYKRAKQKQYGSTTDLIKTGRTKRWMTRAFKLRVGGTAATGNLKANLILTFPFKGGSGRFKKFSLKQIRVQDMIDEVRRFADDEPAILAKWLHEAYMKRVNSFQSSRKRIRISG